MLIELSIRNLATIENARVQFGKGLTMLSGDEGAGKSLLVDALCLLTGGRASTNLIRNGTSSAFIEGVFSVDPGDRCLTSVLNEAGIEIEPDGTLILTREVQEQGKGIARVNRRAVPVSLLRQLGQCLIDIHSQMEHLSLLNAQSQMDLLDSYGGLLDLRREVSAKIDHLRDKTQELKTIAENFSQQQCELLEYQVAEIDSAAIRIGEDEALQQEWQVLQRVQELKEACYVAYSTLYGDDQSASSLVRQAMKALHSAVSIDASLRPYYEALESAAIQLEEAGGNLSGYMESVQDRPERRHEVEKRLDLLYRLKQKYGPTLEKVIQFADDARKKLQMIQSQEDIKRQAQSDYQKLRSEAGKLAETLSKARERTARKLAEQVNAELADLGLAGARFDIKVTREEAQDGIPAYQGAYAFTQHGIDRVQFLASTNPGEPLKPLVFIASGGETCRFMLALKSALRQADLIPTLVFDEIDAGIGGRNASTVGKKLTLLAQNRQVICITHLPQVACFGSEHFKVSKDLSSGRAVTIIEHLAGSHRVRELAAMLGNTNDRMLESAEELLKCASGDGRRKAPPGTGKKKTCSRKKETAVVG